MRIEYVFLSEGDVWRTDQWPHLPVGRGFTYRLVLDGVVVAETVVKVSEVPIDNPTIAACVAVLTGIGGQA